MPSHFDFSGKQVLVTGAAQGIGRGIAERFARGGAQVLIVDHQGDAAEALAADLRSQGKQARALVVDLAGPEAISACLAGLEYLDVLVHNAAHFPLTDFADITPTLLQRTLAINLGALFWLTQGALPLFQRRAGGCVLATSSVTGPRMAYPGLSHYAASKAGVNGFIRNAALELAPRNIRVNGVEPGMIRTPAMANLGDAALQARIASGVPLGRLGEAQDIAAAMLFLASDAASYITGQTLVVDGGATLAEVRPARD
ncbi:SDR family oxidoreductase [Pseudomonas panipatensis]|uniref:SDR family oxidoreductase n=1 Tax=Pseudomonas panipatensis TaxID=428992 RepID=UPI0035B00905